MGKVNLRSGGAHTVGSVCMRRWVGGGRCGELESLRFAQRHLNFKKYTQPNKTRLQATREAPAYASSQRCLLNE